VAKSKIIEAARTFNGAPPVEAFRPASVQPTADAFKAESRATGAAVRRAASPANQFVLAPALDSPRPSAHVPNKKELILDGKRTAERYVTARTAEPLDLDYRTGDKRTPFRQTPTPTNPSYRPAPEPAPAAGASGPRLKPGAGPARTSTMGRVANVAKTAAASVRPAPAAEFFNVNKLEVPAAEQARRAAEADYQAARKAAKPGVIKRTVGAVKGAASGAWNGAAPAADAAADAPKPGAAARAASRIKAAASGAWDGARSAANGAEAKAALAAAEKLRPGSFRRTLDGAAAVARNPLVRGAATAATVAAPILTYALDDGATRERAGGNIKGDDAISNAARASGKVGAYTASGLTFNIASPSDVGQIIQAGRGDLAGARDSYLTTPKNARGWARRAAEALGFGAEGQAEYDKAQEQLAAQERISAQRAAARAAARAPGAAAPGAAATDTKKPPTRTDVNTSFEKSRLAMAKQAAGVGSVDLGAGNLDGDVYGNQITPSTGAGGGMKRNSLASSIGKFGEPVYDNASISRMLARNAGKGGWNADHYGGAQEASQILANRGGGPPNQTPTGTSMAVTGGRAAGASGTSASSGQQTMQRRNEQVGDSFGGYGGFRGSNSRDPQAPNIRGDLFGADIERKGAIENIDAAIKSLTSENGGLNMRSKREIYARLVEQRNEIATMPYDVQNTRDLAGAKMATDVATSNADRGLERDKFQWDQDKFGIDRMDKIAAAEAERNAPPSAKELREADAYNLGRRSKRDNDDEAQAATLAGQYRAADPTMDPAVALSKANQALANLAMDTGQKFDTQSRTAGGVAIIDQFNDEMSQNSDGMWSRAMAGRNPFANNPTLNRNYDAANLEAKDYSWYNPRNLADAFILGNQFDDSFVEGPRDANGNSPFHGLRGELEKSEFEKKRDRAAASRRSMPEY